ncbi:hypothetical protein H5410_049083 [Solanum commersonii]|uniref:Uncharacterized protein n=1 Tax=Solanum commersonii TaxID=4109 RepID=A0A9J5XK32_SOLCO|nr:hypothetical protein H5410_049083 [Solanum commersonii]
MVINDKNTYIKNPYVLPLLRTVYVDAANEAEDTTGSLNDPIRPQWLQFAWPIGKFVAEEVAIYCLGCQWKCCMPDHIPPN